MPDQDLPAHTTRHTPRLRLEPVGPRHARDLWRVFQKDRVAEWYAGRWTMEQAERALADMGEAWASDGVSRWIAFTEVHTVASRGIMERLGMRFDKEIVSEGFVEGREGVHPDAPYRIHRNHGC